MVKYIFPYGEINAPPCPLCPSELHLEQSFLSQIRRRSALTDRISGQESGVVSFSTLRRASVTDIIPTGGFAGRDVTRV
jgi:hypothetical protein